MSRESLARLRSSRAHFRNEVGAQLDHLKDVRGMIFGAVGNVAKTVAIKLTENGKQMKGKNK